MAIYDIYLKNFKSWTDGTTIVGIWTHVQSVPISGEVFFNNPTVKNEMGKAGSCEFSMELGSPCYNSLMQMKTLIQIQYFGRTIFRGRVLTIDRGLSGTRKIHCEGDLSFLLDSVQPPTDEESRPVIDLVTYLGQLITQHNACVYEADKMFELGEVPGHYTNAAAGQQVQVPAEKARQKFGGSDWGTTLDRLEELVGDLGGFLRTRVDDTTGGRYLDWLDNYYDANLNPQSIEIAKNLIDISGTTEVDTLFTVVIPIGKSNGQDIYVSDYWPVIAPGHEKCQHITVPELATIPLFTDAELNTDYHRKEDYAQAINRFGNIWTTVSFPNANTPEKLFNYCKDWMRRSFSPDLTQWSVTALDLGLIQNQNTSPIYVGDRVVLSHKEETANINVFTVISIDYNLYTPEQTKYTIGIPNPQVNTSYGVPIKETKSSSNAGKGKTASGNHKPPPEKTPTPEEVATQNLTSMYLRKTEFGEDIGLDDPLAFVVWKTDGTMYEGDEAKQRALWAADLMARTKSELYTDLVEEARRRGCSWDNEQLVIDFTPELKRAQVQWKIDFERYAQNTLGLDDQQTQVLLNNSSSSSWLASLVDDDGNWTQAAIRAGYPDKPNAEELRQMAIRTRHQLDGTWKPDSQVSLNNVQSFISTLGIDLGDWGNMDSLTQNFNLGDMFDLSGEDLTAKFGDLFNMDLGDMTAYFGDVLNIDLENFTFDLQSIQAWLDGTTGHSLFGKVDDGQGNISWNVMLNHPVTYTGSDGQSHTTLMVSANDIHIPQLTIGGVTYDSLRMRMMVVDELIANRATINQLNAVDARITTVTADMVTTNNLATQIANISGYLNVNQLAITNAMRLDSGATLVVPASSGGISVAASKLTISSGSGEGTTTITPSSFLKEVQIVQVGNTSQYKLQYKTAFASSWTDAGTFNKAVSLRGAWDGSTYSVSATSGTISGTAPSTTVYQSITGTPNPSETVYSNVYKDNPSDATNVILTNELTLVENVTSKKVSLMYSGLEKGAVSTEDTYRAGQDSVDISIRSAAWSWVNDHASVTLSPQAQTFTSPNITGYTPSGNPSYNTSTYLLQQNIIVTDENGDSVVPLSVTINPSSFLESRTGSNKITSNGTYTPSSGKIGFSSVVVDVQTGTTLGGQWSNGTLTVTATPQGTTETFSIADNTTTRTSWSSDKKTATVSVYAATGGSETALDTGKRLTVDATDTYTAGQGSIHLSSSWNSADNQLTIDKTTSGTTNQLTFGVSATPTLLYNTLTHKYTANARAKINGVEHGDWVASEPSGTEAYEAGQQSVIDAGGPFTANENNTYTLEKYVTTLTVNVSTATTLSGSWASGTLTVTATPQGTIETFSIADNTTARTSWSSDKKTATVSVYAVTGSSETALDTGKRLSVNASNAYNAGWAAAVDDVVLPAAGTEGSINVTVPSSTVDGTPSTLTYTLNDAAKNVATLTNPSGTVVARLQHNRYNAGWAAAVSKVILPPTGTSNIFTIAVPPSTVDGAAIPRNYTFWEITSDMVDVMDNSTGQPIAQLIHNQNNKGFTAAKGSYTATNGVLTVSKNRNGSDFPLSFAINAGITYDSATHKYTAKALVDETEMDTAEGDTQAYQDGQTDLINAGESAYSVTSNDTYALNKYIGTLTVQVPTSNITGLEVDTVNHSIKTSTSATTQSILITCEKVSMVYVPAQRHYAYVFQSKAGESSVVATYSGTQEDTEAYTAGQTDLINAGESTYSVTSNNTYALNKYIGTLTVQVPTSNITGLTIDTTNHQIKTSTSSTDQSVTITCENVSRVYTASNNTYAQVFQSKADSSVVATLSDPFVATEAYNAGIDDCWATVGIGAIEYAASLPSGTSIVGAFTPGYYYKISPQAMKSDGQYHTNGSGWYQAIDTSSSSYNQGKQDGYALAINSIAQVTLDGRNQISGNTQYWNFTVCDVNGTVLKGPVSTNGSTIGLIVTDSNRTSLRYTSNGTYQINDIVDEIEVAVSTSYSHNMYINCTAKSKIPGNSSYNYTFTCSGGNGTIASVGDQLRVYW